MKAQFRIIKKVGNVIEEAELLAVSIDSEDIEKIEDSGDCYYQSSDIKVNSMNLKDYKKNPIIIKDNDPNKAIGKAIGIRHNGGKLFVDVQFEPVFFNKLMEEKRQSERLAELQVYLTQFCPVCGSHPVITKETFDGFSQDTGEKEFEYQISCPNHSTIKSFFGRNHYNRSFLVCAKKSYMGSKRRTVLERFCL